MPISLLWAVDVYGQVYSLSTAGQQWERCRDSQMEFKRVAAAQQCCWGIACDNSVYLNVHASDLPVRYQEEAYENKVGLFFFCQTASVCELQTPLFASCHVKMTLNFFMIFVLFLCTSDIIVASSTWSYVCLHIKYPTKF